MKKYFLRFVFATSVAWSYLWLIGVAWDMFLGYDLFAPLLVLCSLLLAVLTCYAAFRKNGMMPGLPVSNGKIFLSLMLWTAAAYAALVPVCGCIMWLLVKLAVACRPALPQPGQGAELSMLITLFAIWYPLWLAPALGAWFSARKLSAGEATTTPLH